MPAADLALIYPQENPRKEEEVVEEHREGKRSHRRKRGQKTSLGKARQTGNEEDIRRFVYFKAILCPHPHCF